MRKSCLIAAVAASAVLAACNDESNVYDMPVEKAFSRIRDVSYSGKKVGDDQAQIGERDYKIVYNEPKSIEWRFTRDTRAGLYHDLVTATLEPVDGNTRTKIGWELRATEADFRTTDEERNKKIWMWGGDSKILREHVDSTLTGRPYDGHNIGS